MKTILSGSLWYHIFKGSEAKRGNQKMKTKLKMLYWKAEKCWVGKLLDHPEIMTQGETLEELEENMKDAFLLMTMDDVPPKHKIKELILSV
jgi:predicted RNase H-like HicB family nuclease